MSTKDISRFLFQPRKRYSGVRMQQGRVILDSDWNESERIDDEEMRRTLVEVICAKGTSNGGFLVSCRGKSTYRCRMGIPCRLTTSPSRTGVFTSAGCALKVQTDVAARHFLSQADWLQIDAPRGNLPHSRTADLQSRPEGRGTTWYTCAVGSSVSPRWKTVSCANGPSEGPTHRCASAGCGASKC